MKASDLMIGDWVIFPNSIEKVQEISYVCGKGYCASFAASATLFPIPIDKLKPIPLTPEILEKNGFIEITGRVKRLIWAWKKHGTLIEVNEASPNCYQIVIHKEASDLGDERVFVKYVHELQHALKLCGIEKTIVV